MIAAFAAALCALYLWLLHASVAGPGALAAKDRLKLVTGVLETLLIFFLAYVIVPWTPLTALVWVAGFGVIGAGVVRAVRRGRELPWVAADSSGRLRWRRAAGPAYAAVLVLLVAVCYATLL